MRKGKCKISRRNSWYLFLVKKVHIRVLFRVRGGVIMRFNCKGKILRGTGYGNLPGTVYQEVAENG